MLLFLLSLLSSTETEADRETLLEQSIFEHCRRRRRRLVVGDDERYWRGQVSEGLRIIMLGSSANSIIAPAAAALDATRPTTLTPLSQPWQPPAPQTTISSRQIGLNNIWRSSGRIRFDYIRAVARLFIINQSPKDNLTNPNQTKLII